MDFTFKIAEFLLPPRSEELYWKVGVIRKHPTVWSREFVARVTVERAAQTEGVSEVDGGNLDLDVQKLLQVPDS